MSDELEAGVVSVLERHGPQPKHALVARLNEGRVAQVEHAELRQALNALEQHQRIVWSAGVVRLAGGRPDLHPDEEFDIDEPVFNDTGYEDPDDPDTVDGPDVPVDTGRSTRVDNYQVATEWRTVKAANPQAAADLVLGEEEAAIVLVIEPGMCDQYERALVTRRVGDDS